MKRFLFAAGVFALIGTAVGAQDTKPADPAKPEQPVPAKDKENPFRAQGKVTTLPAQPGGFGTATTRVTVAKMAALEEDFETLEAQRDVKKAIVKLAEIGLKVAELSVPRYEKLAANNTISKEEVEKVRLEVEVAKAQLEIRIAEMKEVEVKIKHAKKRLDEAKAAAIRPAPANTVVRPAVDPVPPPAPTAPQADPKVVAELKAKLEKLTDEAAKAAAEAKKADENAKVAAEELAAIKRVAMLGRVKAGTIEAAEAKAKEAQAAADAAKEKVKTLEQEIAKLKAKIKEIEK
ncbi:MAG: hypothetical protein K8U57_21635 [Planctomycetes bacterium]|nr:hypothetical protein [Planctomycetota bacterium]